MRVFLFSIDALGVGAAKDYYKYNVENKDANTLKRISENYPNPQDNYLGDLILNHKKEEYEYFAGRKYLCFRLELGYIGADSYVGHQAMMGNVLRELHMTFIEDNLDVIISELKKKYPEERIEYRDGLIYISDNYVIGNNAESDLGVNLNLLALKKQITLEMIKDVALIFRKLCSFERIICMYNNDIDLSNLEQCLTTVQLENRTITRFRVAPLGLYNENYKVYHWCKDSYNVMLDMIKNDIEVNLIGKTADMFEHELFKRCWFESTPEAFEYLIKAIVDGDKNKDIFYFINFQEIDLCGHARDLEGATQALEVLNECFRKFIEQSNEDDCVIITADHGNDPLITANHTREDVPFLVFGNDSVLEKMKEVEGPLELEYISKYLKKLYMVG